MKIYGGQKVKPLNINKVYINGKDYKVIDGFVKYNHKVTYLV